MSTRTCKNCLHVWGGKYISPTQIGGGDAPDIRCTLNPTWLPVRHDHFCSQHLEGGYRYPAERNRWQPDPTSLLQDFRAQKERAIAAEKKLKAANAKIRDLRAKKDG